MKKFENNGTIVIWADALEVLSTQIPDKSVDLSSQTLRIISGRTLMGEKINGIQMKHTLIGAING